MRKIILLIAMLFVSCNLFSQSVDVRGIWNPNPPSDSVLTYTAEWYQSNDQTFNFGTPAMTLSEVDTFTTTRFTLDSNYVALRVRATNRHGSGEWSDVVVVPKGAFTFPGKVNTAGIIRWED